MLDPVKAADLEILEAIANDGVVAPASLPHLVAAIKELKRRRDDEHWAWVAEMREDQTSRAAELQDAPVRRGPDVMRTPLSPNIRRFLAEAEVVDA